MTPIRRAAVLATALFACTAVRGETHALIMAISNYNIAGAPPLKGVVHDVGSARQIAGRLGVREANMVVLRDGELTLQGISGAFDALQARLAVDDDVFVYFSGHGGRQRVSDPEERCAESLITVDGQAFLDTVLEARLKQLAAKANKLIVFIDACHSGGVTTRAQRDARFTGKFLARSGPDACEVPVNVLKRSLGVAARSAGSGAQNYVYIAASRDDEVSLDEADRGGIATQTWRDCVAGGARDLDASGAITADEVRACAQPLIDAKLRNVAGFSPHHISITGNSRAVLGFARGNAAEPAPQAAAAPIETLRDIYSQRDDRRSLSVKLQAEQLTIGKDTLRFSVTSSHAGYLYLVMAGSDGSSFDIVFPNRLDTANAIAAGATLDLPRKQWQLTAAGPAGTTHLLALVSDAPRDFSTLPLRASGPFSVLEARRTSARDIQLVTSGSSAYAAALVAIEEKP